MNATVESQQNAKANSASKSLSAKTFPSRMSCPTINLSEAIKCIDRLKQQLGKGPYGREEIAKALGHASLSGPASRKIAALMQFGLLDRAGNTYIVSALAERILVPTSNEEKNAAITEAASRPSLYHALISKYNSQALPSMLSNIIVREYGIAESNAAQTVANFKSSLDFAQLMRNGVISSEGFTEQSVADTSDQKPAPSTAEPPKQEQKASLQEKIPSESRAIEVCVPGSQIKVVFPEEYAFELSIGRFGAGIEALRKSADELRHKIDNRQKEVK